MPSPSSVTAAVSNVNMLLGLKVFVVTGANEAGGNSAGSAGTWGVTSDSLTPAQTGSLLAFGLAQTTGTYAAYTAASNNTLVDNLQEGATGYGYGDGYYTGTVIAGTPVTVGASDSSGWTASAAYELIPAVGWSFGLSGGTTTYFTVFQGQAASIHVGDTFVNSAGRGGPFTVTSLSAPFGGFVNVSFSPTASSAMITSDTVSGGATPLIDASTPAFVHGASSPVSVTLAPPSGAVLVAVVMGDVTGAPTTVTVSDTLGAGLTWTQRALFAATYEGLAAIFTATLPGGNVTPNAAVGVGSASFGPQITAAMTGTGTLTGAGASAVPAASSSGGTTVMPGTPAGAGIVTQPRSGALTPGFSQALVIAFTAG